MNRLSMEVPIFLKLRMLWNGPLRNVATQPVSWPVKIETALVIAIATLLRGYRHIVTRNGHLLGDSDKYGNFVRKFMWQLSG
jgi:hypothetical protein